MGDWISQPVNHFHGRLLPEPGLPVGYAALIQRFDLALPLPRLLTAIATRHRSVMTEAWRVLTPRQRPADTVEGHLTFALKWEGVNLPVLAALFRVIEPDEVTALIRATPTGAFARRIWFLHEWLSGRELDVPDPGKVLAVPVLNPQQQVALVPGVSSARHKVIDNLPGSARFCPLVWWTPALRAAVDKRLDVQARALIGRTHKDLVARAAAFLLLNDSKSSFAIEGEKPSNVRAARWAAAIGQAGAQALSIDELERLQRVVIGDARFVRLGLRDECGFVGTHDRTTREPIPDHISARPQDLGSLIGGIIDFQQRATAGAMDAVITAAATAFGFVYVHPFADGNGRLHRWLVHHTLATAGYNPPGLVFPISAAILRHLDDYAAVLSSYSAPLLPFIEWRATTDGNVEVLNDTAAYYRYFDATRHAEFLYACVEQTVEHDLPDEVRYLEAFDRFAASVKEIVEMPDRQIALMRGFLEQGGGRFSRRAREHEFAALTDREAETIEALYAELFGGSPS